MPRRRERLVGGLARGAVADTAVDIASLVVQAYAVCRGGAVGAPGLLDTADGVPTGTCAGGAAARGHRVAR